MSQNLVAKWLNGSVKIIMIIHGMQHLIQELKTKGCAQFVKNITIKICFMKNILNLNNILMKKKMKGLLEVMPINQLLQFGGNVGLNIALNILLILLLLLGNFGVLYAVTLC